MNEVVRPIEAGVNEVKAALGQKADQLLPDTKRVTTINREDFISRTFKYEEGPTIKHTIDGYIYEVTFDDASRVYVCRHKTSNGNPFADPAVFGEWLPMGGLDSRVWETFTYEWNGKRTIVATTPKGEVSKYTGRNGNPKVMLPTLRSSLGHFRRTVSFASQPGSVE